MTSRAAFLAVALALVLAGSSACKRAPVEASPTAQLINDLSLFALGDPVREKDRVKLEAELASGKLTVEQYIDGLLAKPMGGRMAKDLVVSPSDTLKDRHPLPAHSILRSFKNAGEPVYFLKKKCDPAEATPVVPWWDTASKDGGPQPVLVCPDAHRPDVKGDPNGRTCGSSMLAPRETDVCGCGPKLMYCSRDEAHFNRLQQEMYEELLATTGYVVDQDMPIEELFTMNATARTNIAEAFYRRARVAAGEDPGLLPVTGFSTRTLQPRVEQVPGQHAGILTTPALTYSSDALRGVMRNYFEYLWCSGVASSRVTTESVMNLGVVDLRVGDGWKQLAAMPVCTDCHARLDYGMQFFSGYPSSTMGVDFRPADVQKGEGALYNHDIKDERGTAPLTPQGFAKLAVAQPEFGKCMTRKVVDHVFNGTAEAADVEAVHKAFEKTHRIKAMLRVAMLRYAERNKDGAPPPAIAAAVEAKPAKVADEDDPLVKVTPALRRMLDDDCMQCHDKGDAFEFHADELRRSTLALMMDQVGFGGMPATAAGLPDAKRVAFVAELAPLVYADALQRRLAVEFFSYGMRGRPVHRFRSAMTSVQVHSGTKRGFRPSSIETAVDQSLMSFTPGVALSAAMAALADCKEAKLEGDELRACVARSSSPANIIVGAVTPASN